MFHWPKVCSLHTEVLLSFYYKLHLTFEVSPVNVVYLTLNKQDKGICGAYSHTILELFAIYLFSLQKPFSIQ